MADLLGWRWEFGVQVAPLLIFIGAAAVEIPSDLGLDGNKETVRNALKSFDIVGTLLLSAAITSLVLGLVGFVAAILNFVVCTDEPRRTSGGIFSGVSLISTSEFKFANSSPRVSPLSGILPRHLRRLLPYFPLG